MSDTEKAKNVYSVMLAGSDTPVEIEDVYGNLGEIMTTGAPSVRFVVARKHNGMQVFKDCAMNIDFIVSIVCLD